MADVENCQSTGTRWDRLLGCASTLGLVALALWLTVDQEVVALDSPHDEQFFLQRARCGYWFDQGYTHFSFIKEPIYPLFAGICYLLGIPLRLATEGVYLGAAGFFSWSMVRRRPQPWWGLLVFGTCVLHPMRFAVFRQTTADALYPSLLLLSLGALLRQIQDAAQPAPWRRGFFSGLALGLLWNTRAERPLVALILLCFLAAGAYNACRRASTWKIALQQWLAEWALPPVVVAVVALTILSANYARFGVWATRDLNAPGYWAAYQALVAIQPDRSLRCVPVTREARAKAYTASPSFRELQPYLEGQLGERYASYGRQYYDLPPGEIAGGWFCWAVRDAAAEAGHCGSAEESEAFYRKIAGELHAAAAEGRLPTRAVLPFSLDPDAANYLPYLPSSAAKLWNRCWTSEEPPALQDHLTDIRQLFDTVAHRRCVPTPPTAQSHVRSWLWLVYGPLLHALLITGGLVFAVVLMLRRNTPGFRWYVFISLVVGITGFSRLGLFTLIDASAFPGDALRYLFPLALTLSVLATWLTAKGLLLLASPCLGGDSFHRYFWRLRIWSRSATPQKIPGPLFGGKVD
jgi:hypothetical protein